ncbi:UDP-glucose:Glyco protein glucosyltransferase-domain-containing protein [Syncephalastrum racemosum]|uniref:UDP-glucose:Glyco protein glucosyltransferase-domain-containing protein n=1 Tax=Syncephalastrum racemosum TaxID=13706 RepID=A0A1X2HN96_SYNRA|nr:UDP-glucose:Glyco protein glucosyltransferase-domain-containing protein [Syncephalastrum racemosum]
MTRAFASIVFGLAVTLQYVGKPILAASASSTPVDVTLVAPWSAPDLLVEIAETVAGKNDTRYFDIVGRLATLTTKSTPQALYKTALDTLALTERELETAKLALSIHAAAPRVESHMQYFESHIQKDEQPCDIWIETAAGYTCDIDAMAATAPLNLLPFDRVLRTRVDAPTAILYTPNLSHPEFLRFHRYLSAQALEGQLAYIIRYAPSKSASPSPPLTLAGYGVELALKNTDYLVIDDREKEDQQEQDSTVKSKLAGLGKKISQTLFDTGAPATIEPLASKEIKDLGLKAAKFIRKSKKPLNTLVQLSQDFPKYAHRVSELHLDESDQNTFNSIIAQGENSMWINGLPLDSTEVEAFSLVRILRQEADRIAGYERLGLNSRQAIDVMTHPALAGDHTDESVKDIYDVRSELVEWWNDLEKDKRYKGWSSNIFEILKPVYPGQLRAIRRNIYSLVMVEDLTSLKSLERVATQIQAMIKHNTPIRFGILPLVSSSTESKGMALALHHILQNGGKADGMTFLNKVLEGTMAAKHEHTTMEIVEQSFQSVVQGLKSPREEDIESRSVKDLLPTGADYIASLVSFLNQFGIASPTMFMNGKLVEIEDDATWTRSIMAALQEQTQLIQRKVYFNEIEHDADFYQELLSASYVAKSRNPYIIESDQSPLRMVRMQDISYELLNGIRYFSNSEEAKYNVWIITDLNTAHGLELARNGLLFSETAGDARVAIFHCPDNMESNSVSPPAISNLLNTRSKTEDALNIIDKLLAAKEVGDDDTQIKISKSSDTEKSTDKPFLDGLESVGLERGFQGIIFNGRVIGPLNSAVVFSVHDFSNLAQYETDKRIEPVREALAAANVKDMTADKVMQVTAITNTPVGDEEINVPRAKKMLEHQVTGRERPYKDSNVDIQLGDKEKAYVEIGVFLDPVSETAQKWSAILETLSSLQGVYICIHLNPVSHLDEIPLKRFYRYVFDAEPHYDPTDGTAQTPTAYFSDLPVDALYTLGVDTIKSWHVTVKEANDVDLDNIVLKDGHVSAVYELERILIEGHCLDSVTLSPPRGLQFVLSNTTDTIVMANLGYFQLKSRPGLWELTLREGRSREIYTIDTLGTGNNEDDLLALTSFEGLTLYPEVRKKPGKEKEDVLVEMQQQKGHDEGILSSLKHKLFGDKSEEPKPAVAKQADINVFSVASGLLYERFMSIMIASVMENTNHTVKFWFIENFLSPSFKDFVPSLAQELGFDYEMVTYKWPSWLRAQKEKQRTIWGYKILFLDVLFPLDLEKVIFVDADQIVRTDLKELVDMDLHGAPYGYTPFCTDRTEMDGFRFWTQGYWKEHLRDKPYHISALYVIDLVRFRQLAAGDRLRAQYQQLSADPHSLANLDQDLPNNMQHIVPIYSLPQEWLWCETWCSDESLKSAKTIDLCNNPMTKEPKLDRARRQVPEWEVYDRRVAALRKGLPYAKAKELEKEHKTLHIVDEL